MKRLFVLNIILPICLIIHSQEALDILCRCEQAYRSLSNFSDRGIYSTYYTSAENTFENSAEYYIAIDRKGNTTHWINAYRQGRPGGYTYTLSAPDTLGVFIRKSSPLDTVGYSLAEACGALFGVGGGLLNMYATLFYDTLLIKSSGDASWIQHYDTLRRLPDTLFRETPCYVLQSIRLNQVTQAMVDRSNQYLDSMRIKYALPSFVETPKRIAGISTLIGTYIIRKEDFILLSWSEEVLSPEGMKSIKTVIANPLFNLADFESYLKAD